MLPRVEEARMGTMLLSCAMLIVRCFFRMASVSIHIQPTNILASILFWTNELVLEKVDDYFIGFLLYVPFLVMCVMFPLYALMRFYSTSYFRLMEDYYDKLFGEYPYTL